MRFEFTEDQRDFASVVRDYLEKESSPSVLRQASKQTAASDWFDKLWSGLVELGVTGAAISEPLGGFGGSVSDLLLVVEAIGEYLPPVPLTETAFVVPAVLSREHESQAASELLRLIASGEVRIATVRCDQSLVPFAGEATHLLMERGDDLILVDAHEVNIQPVAAQDARSRTCRVEVPGDSGQTIVTGRELQHRLRAAIDIADAVMSVGISEKLLQLTVEFVGARQQFGRAIGSFQAVKHQLADLVTNIEASRSLVWRAGYELDAGGDPGHWASVASGSSAETAGLASKTALQLHGGIGFTEEADLQIWLHAAEAFVARQGSLHHSRSELAKSIIALRGA